jgi:uncharacterized RDD family membrane protein YckC
MARWTQTWLSGPGAAGVDTGFAQVPRGVRLGLPADGPGSVPGFGARSAAFAVDAVLSGLAALLLFPVRDVEDRSITSDLAPVVVLAVVYLVGLTLTGQTLGMRLFRLRVRPVPRPGAGPAGPVLDATPALRVGLVSAALRTALLVLLVPALISDRDRRGLHDMAAGTVVVRD